MDASRKVMENLDSLWFFNNVITLTPPLHHKQNPSIEEEDIVEEENRNSDSDSNILHDVLVGAKILVPRCPNCCEISDVGVEQRTEVPQPVQAAEFVKPERRKRGGRRRSKRKVVGLGAVGELDSGFYGNFDSESSFSEATNGQYYYSKMPPFYDGSAMKEHLKSWAYAVACTVR